MDGVECYPDFNIVDDDSGITWYWEYNRMLSNEEYKARWQRKLLAHEKEGILPGEHGGGRVCAL